MRCRTTLEVGESPRNCCQSGRSAWGMWNCRAVGHQGYGTTEKALHHTESQLCISLGLLCLATLFVCAKPAYAEPPGTPPAIEVYFSPKGGCTESVVRELRAANQSVLVQAYSFTSAPIAKALVDAHKRGVKVQVILDKSQRTDKYSSATFLHNAGIPTSIDTAHAIAHNKIMVIDGAVLITGSFNFTKAAGEKNAENLLVVRDRQLAAKYAANWEVHFKHSERYELPFRLFGRLWGILGNWWIIFVVLALLALSLWWLAANRRNKSKIRDVG